jgi:very-short-patch-repair endonuclease
MEELKKCSKCKIKRCNGKSCKSFVCIVCEKEFFRIPRKGRENNFCGRSCASKFYIQNGTYDKWRLLIQPRKGVYKNCEICGQQFYIKNCQAETKLYCSRKCCGLGRTIKYSGENANNYGRKESEETKQKKKDTLMMRYGVDNAYKLAKHEMLSRPQKELTNKIKKLFKNCKIISDYPIGIGKYKVDIFIKEKNIIIEFNGNYWHCNPKIYKEDFFNKKKGMFAKEIWEYDSKRKKELENMGFKVLVVWENDYKNDEKEVIKNLMEGIND